MAWTNRFRASTLSVRSGSATTKPATGLLAGVALSIWMMPLGPVMGGVVGGGELDQECVPVGRVCACILKHRIAEDEVEFVVVVPRPSVVGVEISLPL